MTTPAVLAESVGHHCSNCAGGIGKEDSTVEICLSPVTPAELGSSVFHHGLAGLQVNIQDGSVADTYLLQDDFVHASHNFGIHLWDDLLLVVGVSRCWSFSDVPE